MVAALSAPRSSASARRHSSSRLRHDAVLPPRHLPGGHRYSDPALRAACRARPSRWDVLRLRGRGSASSSPPWVCARSMRQSGAPTCSRPTPPRPLEPRGSTSSWLPRPDLRRLHAAAAARACRPTVSSTPASTSALGRARAARDAPVSLDCPPITNRRPHGGPVSVRDRGTSRRRRAPPRTVDVDLHGRPARASAPSCRGCDCGSSATPTTTVGKGLSGGEIDVRPPAGSTFASRGADHRRQRDPLRRHRRRGVLRGQVGERFCVRNSGATAVVEGWATTAAST